LTRVAYSTWDGSRIEIENDQDEITQQGGHNLGPCGQVLLAHVVVSKYAGDRLLIRQQNRSTFYSFNTKAQAHTPSGLAVALQPPTNTSFRELLRVLL
jgi:hypothetical protein